MAYCVRCGVELAPSEKVCPLCLTPVVIPGEAAAAAVEKPYPDRLEAVSASIDHRYGAKLALLFLLVPLVAVLVCNLAISYQITWSAYVLGAGACLGCWAILPIYLNGHRPYLYLSVDFLAAAGYLLLIAWRAGGLDWYGNLALPLTGLAGGLTLLLVWAARRSRLPVLLRISNMILIAAVSLIGVEALIDRYARGAIRLQWSVYALISLTALAGIIWIIEKNAKLKSAIARRLFL